MGAVPAKARGLWHTAPTYLRRRPGSPSNGLLGSALGIFRIRRYCLDLDQRRSEESPTPRGPCAPPRGGVGGRPRGLQPASRRGGLAPGAPLAPSGRVRVSSAPRRAGHARAFASARRRGLRDRAPGRCRPGIGAHFSSLAAGRPHPHGERCRFAEPLETAPAVDPDLLFVPLACFDRRGHRIGYGAGFYDRSLARLRAIKPVHAIGVAYGICEVAAVPDEATIRPLTPS